VVFGLWTPLNILAVCLAFIITFTILMGILLYRMTARRKKAESPSSPNDES
jgi:hypothetical protein